ncbi:MAG: bile acid:sodium symporter family protein [Maritimibacter sp.]|nr:bile acid:sodium symporter family protein [Maritimibacter sp.]
MNEMISAFLPAGMMVLMLSLGLRLDPAEAGRAVRQPRALLTGLAVQVIGLPLIAFAVSRGLGLAPALTAGLMLVAASPGGVTSNYAALLARGSVGLSVTMTLLTSLAAPITLPLVLLAASVTVPGAAALWKISLAMVAVALVPILVGVLAAKLAPRLAAGVSRRLDPLARLLFLAIVLATFWQNWGAMGQAFTQVGAAVTLFAVLAPVLAFLAGAMARLRASERRTIMVEATMQNVAITIFVASALMRESGLAIPGLIYAVEMNLVVLLLIGWAQYSGRGARRADQPA